MPDHPLQRLTQHLYPGGALLRTWPLGGVSAQVKALEVRSADGQIERLVVRQYGAANLAGNPNSAADEFRLLSLRQSAGLAVPAPIWFDQAGQLFPSPTLVTAYVDGQPNLGTDALPDGLRQLANALRQLHAVHLIDLDASFLRSTPGLPARPTVLDHSLSEAQIRDALEPIWPPTPPKSPAILHGDFWPGNALWRDGRLAAVIDWEDAALGDPLADLGNARLELLWAFGQKAMTDFTRHYQAGPDLDFGLLPYWDLYAALRPAGRLGSWGLNAQTEQTMRARHRQFVDEALAQLSRP